MRLLTAAMIVAVFATPAMAKVDEQRIVAERLVAAIGGSGEFIESDFVKPLKAADKSALSMVGKCKFEMISRPAYPVPNRPGKYIDSPNELSLLYKCPKVSYGTRVGITLEFEEVRIGKIQTHNFDMIR